MPLRTGQWTRHSSGGWKIVNHNRPAVSTSSLPIDDELSKLKKFIYSKSRLVCITGAGISTHSGIPDYRGPNGSYQRGHKPMNHNEFITREGSRKRYWSRSIVGYQAVRRAQPNDAHKALHRLEQQGVLRAIITQNVDGLHQKAGSVNVIDLHGRIDSVSCLSCRAKVSRDEFQLQLESRNVAYRNMTAEEEVRPDGDVDLGGIDTSTFVIPVCGSCGGVLKPDVVFFGDTVPKENKDRAIVEVEGSDGLLIVGSSLEVFSAFRLVRRALELGKEIAVLNLGETRLHRFHREELARRTNSTSHVVGDDVTASAVVTPLLVPESSTSELLLINADCCELLHSVIKD